MFIYHSSRHWCCFRQGLLLLFCLGHRLWSLEECILISVLTSFDVGPQDDLEQSFFFLVGLTQTWRFSRFLVKFGIFSYSIFVCVFLLNLFQQVQWAIITLFQRIDNDNRCLHRGFKSPVGALWEMFRYNCCRIFSII